MKSYKVKKINEIAVFIAALLFFAYIPYGNAVEPECNTPQGCGITFDCAATGDTETIAIRRAKNEGSKECKRSLPNDCPKFFPNSDDCRKDLTIVCEVRGKCED